MVMKITKKAIGAAKQEQMALAQAVDPEESVGVGMVSITNADGSEQNENVEIPVKVDVATGNVGYVGLSMGLTRNLGDFESLKMLVSLIMPCEATPSGVETAYQEVKEWVDQKVSEINAEVDAQLS